MKLAAAKLQSFINKPDLDFKYILIYGVDSGLVSIYYNKIAKYILGNDVSDPFRFCNLDYQKIKDDSSVYLDELLAQSLIGGQRLIKLDNLSSSLNKSFIDIMENNNPETISIFLAGELKTSSSLRKFFEKSKNAITIACYKDDEQSISYVIQNKLRENNINYNGDVMRFLQSKLLGNRQIVENELEKLILSLGDKKTIDLEDAQKLIIDSKEVSIDKITNSFASGNLKELESSIESAFSENMQPIVIIRSLINYFMRIKQVKDDVNSGLNIDSAVTKLRPPIFFKQMPAFKQHLSKWNSKVVDKVLVRLFDLEIDCKTTNKPAELICKNTLLLLPYYFVKR